MTSLAFSPGEKVADVGGRMRGYLLASALDPARARVTPHPSRADRNKRRPRATFCPEGVGY
jgi:hypothetical protein